LGRGFSINPHKVIVFERVGAFLDENSSWNNTSKIIENFSKISEIGRNKRRHLTDFWRLLK